VESLFKCEFSLEIKTLVGNSFVKILEVIDATIIVGENLFPSLFLD
jgi:hypothetical protein